jgi:hypothetical protein
MKEGTLVFYKEQEGLHSTFKVLEPIFRKSTNEKSRNLFGRKFGTVTTAEFFRKFDEFYIPTECFTIDLFNEYIAISTKVGFELLTLAKKVPTTVPDLNILLSRTSQHASPTRSHLACSGSPVLNSCYAMKNVVCTWTITVKSQDPS